MSHTSKEAQGAAAALEEETELEQTDELSIVQRVTQPKEPRRSERARILTEKGKSFRKRKLKGYYFALTANMNTGKL